MDQVEAAQLRETVVRLSGKVERLEKIIMSFRQAQLIMTASVEDGFGMERSKQPKHKTAHRSGPNLTN